MHPILFGATMIAAASVLVGTDAMASETFVSSSLFQLVTFLPFLLILTVALWRSGVWERRVIRDELADEVRRTVSADEYRDIVSDRMFRTRRIGRLQPRIWAALVNAQHELAFRKRRVRDAGESPEHNPLIAGWREEIRRLREVV
jgi:protease PrsW